MGFMYRRYIHDSCNRFRNSRSKSTGKYIPIIERIVRPGSIIHTDEARFYTRLKNEEYGFTHLTVCHKFNFVDSESGIHTQHVESWNNKLKSKIKIFRGLDEDKRENFLQEFQWLEHKEHTFEEILQLLIINK